MPGDAATLPKPAIGSIQIGQDGKPWVAGYRCPDCGAAFIETSLACRRCASRKPPEIFHASDTGVVYAWTIVARSYPGVVTPFASVIIDLSDGLTLKGTLRGIDMDKVAFGLPVKLVFDDAGGAVDANGTPYVGFHFIPSNGAN
jgi:uncharacterized OB-fold protein